MKRRQFNTGNPPARRAFTLVELLVVITIIGILIALLLPAVQVAREAARMAQCRNNIKQLALGCLGHESATKRFPAGGWGFGWTGDPDRGNDWRQPGGWIYNVLPYIEQQALHDLGMGTGLSSPAKVDAGTQRIATPISLLNCPTRRRPILYRFFASPSGPNAWFYWTSNMRAPSVVARTDYAMCGGEFWTFAEWMHPIQNRFAGPAADLSSSVFSKGGYLYVNDPQFAGEVRNMLTTFNLSTAWPQGVPGPAKANGVGYALSMTRACDITDGLSNTYLLGEKNLCPDAYDSAEDAGDNVFALIGFHYDIYRFSNDYSHCFDGKGKPCSNWSGPGPYIDTPGDFTHCVCFGSAHFSAFNMAFCDGSVRSTDYSIDLATHSRLCNRHDGQKVDGRKF